MNARFFVFCVALLSHPLFLSHAAPPRHIGASSQGFAYPGGAPLLAPGALSLTHPLLLHGVQPHEGPPVAYDSAGRPLYHHLSQYHRSLLELHGFESPYPQQQQPQPQEAAAASMRAEAAHRETVEWHTARQRQRYDETDADLRFVELASATAGAARTHDQEQEQERGKGKARGRAAATSYTAETVSEDLASNMLHGVESRFTATDGSKGSTFAAAADRQRLSALHQMYEGEFRYMMGFPEQDWTYVDPQNPPEWLVPKSPQPPGLPVTKPPPVPSMVAPPPPFPAYSSDFGKYQDSTFSPSPPTYSLPRPPPSALPHWIPWSSFYVPGQPTALEATPPPGRGDQ